MALIHCTSYSETLGMDMPMTIVRPDRQDNPRVLYLLHGRGDDHSAWARFSSIERYAEEHGIAVVMPQAAVSYYRDMASGPRYWTYLSEELPARCATLFGLPTDRSRTFVAGLSMGGYGAMQWALRCPDRIAAAASMSGALDVASGRAPGDEESARVWDAVFGTRDLSTLAGTDADLTHLLSIADPASLPKLYVDCGTDDSMLARSRAFVDVAARHGIAVTTHWPPGDHHWSYWDAAIQRVLNWLPGADD